MATNVIMPVLGVSQDSGKVLQWYKKEGQVVRKGEPLLEVETDKAVLDIEAPASGTLVHVRVADGQEVPVTEVIAVILAEGEADEGIAPAAETTKDKNGPAESEAAQAVTRSISPLAARIAAEHAVDVARIPSDGNRIEKADVLAYLKDQKNTPETFVSTNRPLASPKARRLAAEHGVTLMDLHGSGPQGAVVAVDIPLPASPGTVTAERGEVQTISTIWRLMAKNTTQSWTSVPHFFLLREVNASRLISWRESLLAQLPEKITYTDLLVKIVAAALRRNMAMNAMWENNTVVRKTGVHISLAVAQEGGLVVPVIHHADQLSVAQIAQARVDLVSKARAGKLRSQEIADGTFTISNLGMYGVDAFSAIINTPQAGILAVGRIADRVTALQGVPVVQPMLILSLSCDHRVVDGARGAQFLETIANLIEEPAGLVQ